MIRSPATSRSIRAARPPKQRVDPFRPLGKAWESERTASGDTVPVLTVFLAGAECAFTCLFCDLWRFTLDGPTPLGAIPSQLEHALAPETVPGNAVVKLYNASNFFDDRAVPPADDDAIAHLVAPFARVIVECHPRLVGDRCLSFAERTAGRLEVAMGLETVFPGALEQLNKGMRVADFDAAADRLLAHDIDVRVFVLVGAPFVPRHETVDWVVRSVEHALARGACHVSLIPVRAGNGALEAVARDGDFYAPSLRQVEQSLERCVELRPGVVTADLWDVERFFTCRCSQDRAARLHAMNASGCVEPSVGCTECEVA